MQEFIGQLSFTGCSGRDLMWFCIQLLDGNWGTTQLSLLPHETKRLCGDMPDFILQRNRTTVQPYGKWWNDFSTDRENVSVFKHHLEGVGIFLYFFHFVCFQGGHFPNFSHFLYVLHAHWSNCSYVCWDNRELSHWWGESHGHNGVQTSGPSSQGLRG